MVVAQRPCAAWCLGLLLDPVLSGQIHAERQRLLVVVASAAEDGRAMLVVLGTAWIDRRCNVRGSGGGAAVRW